MPSGYYTVTDRNPDAYRLSAGWIGKMRGNGSRLPREHAVAGAPARIAGSFAVPVLLGVFSGQGAPYASATLQAKLFDGPSATGTVADYYNEVSYGNFTIDGTVTDWFTVSALDTFYEGNSNGLVEGDARAGQFIKELLDANDSAVDFGAFDNDGPDGVPNSGDDDGFVDLLVVMHNELGGECGGNANIWSHSRDYRAWPVSGGVAYVTGDASLSGGFIRITDYAILPALDCASDTLDIGGLCHEIGHALGVPDLFGDGSGASGIGDWGLMGSGQWNTPASPAHPCAWTRAQLGWVTPTIVGPQGANENIPDIETNPACFQLGFTDGHFERMSECAIGGSFSLRCGIDAAEAAVRGWEGGSGYGNLWDETIEREFTYDGTQPVSLRFALQYDLEFNYDSVFVSVCADTVETVVVTYTGVGGGAKLLDISSVLAPLGADTTYTVKFRVVTDPFNSDEDGDYLSTCGALVIDDIMITGGGLNYSEDFETSVGGWFQDPARAAGSEYWLVENRQAIGFDSSIHNSGLLIYHVDDAVLRSKLGNSGGNVGTTVRGIVVEEADNQFHLLQDPQTTGNSGDASDPFPGSLNNTTFDAGSSPGASDNSGNPTIIEVSNISASGSPMTAFLRAGDPAPVAAAVDPDTVDNDTSPVAVTITGANVRPGAVFRLEKTGEPDIVARSILWQDSNELRGDLPIYGRAGGDWDLIVTNNDGQEDTIAAGINLMQIVAAQLAYAAVDAREDRVELSFRLLQVEAGETFVLHRSNRSDGPFVRLEGALQRGVDDWFFYVDDTVLPGRTYYYRLEAHDGSEARELYRGSATTPSRKLELTQNYPNPFNPTTKISFYLPESARVRLDVYDVSGARVRTLVQGFASAGAHHPVWDGRDDDGDPVGSGVYFYRLTSGKTQLTRKMVLLK